MSGDGDDTCDICGHTGYFVTFVQGGGALCRPGHGCQRIDHPVMHQSGCSMCVCGAPESEHRVSAESDEGMLREAHDLIRGVKQWPNSTFAWVASDWLERCARRFPNRADVVEDDPS